MAESNELPGPTRSVRSPLDRGTIEFEIGDQIGRADIPALCERARVLLERVDTDRLVCDMRRIRQPDGVTIDALARLQLTARRLGREIWLTDASVELQELLAFVGLSSVVAMDPGSGFEASGQAEDREQGGRVEEEADSADPTG